MQSLSVADLLPAAVAIALNPPAIMAVILLLSSPGARKSAFWFVLGWLVGLLAVGGVVLLVGGVGGLAGGPSRTGLIVKILLGALLLAFAAGQWRRHAASDEAQEMPGWVRAIIGFSPAKAFATAALFSAFNPKTLALNVAGVLAIAEAQAGASVRLLLLVLFALVGSSTVVAPVAYYLVRPTHSGSVFEATQEWLIVHNKAIMAIVLLLLGVMLISSGVQGLVAS